MTTFLLSVIVGAGFSWGSQFVPGVSADEAGAAGGTGGAGSVFVAKAADGDGTGVTHAAGAEPRASQDRKQVSLLLSGDLIGNEDVDADAGWLGVQLGDVQADEKAKAKGTQGIAILNVAKDSPASAAGFERDDLLVEIDDVAVADDLPSMVNVVRNASAGERMKFTVIRDGERHTLVATLGRRGDAKNVEWVYDTGATFEALDALSARAKVLRQGKGGVWHFEIPDGEDGFKLPDNIAELVPGIHSRITTFSTGDNGKHIAINIVHNGQSLSIKTTDDGRIKVTRKDLDSGEETAATYADAKELAANDKEAFDAYDGADGHDVSVSREFQMTLGTGSDDPAAWLEAIEANIAQQSSALAEAVQKLKNIRVEISSDGDGTDVPEGNTFLQFMNRDKPAQTIRENPDGTIDVIVRKGDNELVTRYADEADLQSRNAKAHETFLDLKANSEE